MRKDFGGPRLHTQPHVFQQKVACDKGIGGRGALTSPIWSSAPEEGLCDPNYASFFFDDFFEYITADALIPGWNPGGQGIKASLAAVRQN